MIFLFLTMTNPVDFNKLYEIAINQFYLQFVKKKLT